jgi:NDP-mannose synthase
MCAVILAGGRGTRLAPYTTILPKPLMPVDDMPILEIVIRQLARHGFSDLTLAVGHLSELIMAYFGDGSKFNVHLSYSHEDQPLGTAGPIALVPDLKDTFLVMNGDLLTTVDHSSMLNYHRERKSMATVACYQRDVKIDLGVLEVDPDNWVANYIEKPTYHYKVSMGIYLFEPAVLEYIPKNQHLDLPELVIRLMTEGHKVNTYNFDGYWLDIGRPDDYEQAITEFSKNREKFLEGG